MPPPPSTAHGGPEQTVLQKLSMGAMMGGTVGLSIGFIFGTFGVMMRGASPQGALKDISRTMLASGATFGTFMSIGTVIRTEGRSLTSEEQDAYRSQYQRNSGLAYASRLKFALQEAKS